MRCKHLNAKVQEQYIGYGNHYFQNGKFVENWNDASRSDLTDRIDVICDDCELDKTYYRRHLPKWLQNYMSQIRNP
jgi:hypothetical protein